MFGILFHVEVKPSMRQAFIDFIDWDARVAREREPRTLRFDLYQDPKDVNAFFVYEAYLDHHAFEEHKQNEPFKRWESRIEPEMLTHRQNLFEGEVLRSSALAPGT